MYFFCFGIEHVEFSRLILDEYTNSTESTPKHECTKNKITDKFPFNMTYSVSGNIEPNKLFSKPLYN